MERKADSREARRQLMKSTGDRLGLVAGALMTGHWDDERLAGLSDHSEALGDLAEALAQGRVKRGEVARLTRENGHPGGEHGLAFGGLPLLKMFLEAAHGPEVKYPKDAWKQQGDPSDTIPVDFNAPLDRLFSFFAHVPGVDSDLYQGKGVFNPSHHTSTHLAWTSVRSNLYIACWSRVENLPSTVELCEAALPEERGDLALAVSIAILHPEWVKRGHTLIFSGERIGGGLFARGGDGDSKLGYPTLFRGQDDQDDRVCFGWVACDDPPHPNYISLRYSLKL